ncbi:MAG: copper resistance protein NlpE N-terminal domain-containing protein [Pseudomonadota bacterium]
MQIRTLLAGTALAALLAGCAAGPADQAAGPEMEATTATYQGMLPCRNCEGIDLDVTLNGEEQSAAEERTFDLQASYREHPQDPPDENYEGNWEVLEGTEQDSSAIVYELTPDGEGQTYYFLRVDEQTLELIDPNLRRFQNSEMLQLKRQ